MTTPDAERVKPVALPFRKSLERLLDEAENPKGMSVHNGKASVPCNWIRYLLKRIDLTAPPAASQPAQDMTADEATENAAIVILTHVLGGEITDEFWAWYKPEQWLGIHRAVAAFIITKSQPAQPIQPKLWLWKNGDHFLAFEHEYPCFGVGGDPMTLGEPIGYAIFMRSSDRDAQAPLTTQQSAQYAAPPADSARADRIMELANELVRVACRRVIDRATPFDEREARAALEAEVRKG